MKGYTYFKIDSGYWMVANPYGVEIAQTLTWRTARKIARCLNNDAEWHRFMREIKEEIRKEREEATP